MVAFTPLSDYVLVNPIAVETVTASGIVTVSSDSAKTPTTGIVVKVGPGRTDRGTCSPTTVKVADKVMWAKFAGVNVIIGGEHFLLMHESDIVGILE